MAKEAAGAYLRFLRESRKLGRPSVANRIWTSENQVKRIEDGEIDSRGSLLLAFCHAVQGNPGDLQYLMSNPKLTREEGKALATEWLQAQTKPLTDDERKDLRSKIQDWLQNVPDLQQAPEDKMTYVTDENIALSQWKSAMATLRRLMHRGADEPAQ